MIELAVPLSMKEETKPCDFAVDAVDPLFSVTGNELPFREYVLKIIKATLSKHVNDFKLVAKNLYI
jgi:hypothetical protein